MNFQQLIGRSRTESDVYRVVLQGANPIQKDNKFFVIEHLTMVMITQNLPRFSKSKFMASLFINGFIRQISISQIVVSSRTGAGPGAVADGLAHNTRVVQRLLN